MARVVAGRDRPHAARQVAGDLAGATVVEAPPGQDRGGAPLFGVQLGKRSVQNRIGLTHDQLVELDDSAVECPRHGGRFDLFTGRVLALPPVRPVVAYETVIAGDEIQVRLP